MTANVSESSALAQRAEHVARLAAKATIGPWVAKGGLSQTNHPGSSVAMIYAAASILRSQHAFWIYSDGAEEIAESADDAEFIAHAPAMAQLIAEQRDHIAALESALHEGNELLRAEIKRLRESLGGMLESYDVFVSDFPEEADAAIAIFGGDPAKARHLLTSNAEPGRAGPVHMAITEIEALHPLAAETPAADAQDGWQSIETAPMDGTHILACWPKISLDDDGDPTGKIVGHLVAVTFFAGGWVEPNYLDAAGPHFGDDFCYADVPSHWMPLPASPAAIQSAEKQ